MWHLPWGPDKSSVCHSSSRGPSGRKSSAEALRPDQSLDWAEDQGWQTQWCGGQTHLQPSTHTWQVWTFMLHVKTLVDWWLLCSGVPYSVFSPSLFYPWFRLFPLDSHTQPISEYSVHSYFHICRVTSVNAMHTMQRDHVLETTPVHGQSIQ